MDHLRALAEVGGLVRVGLEHALVVRPLAKWNYILAFDVILVESVALTPFIRPALARDETPHQWVLISGKSLRDMSRHYVRLSLPAGCPAAGWMPNHGRDSDERLRNDV